MNGKQVVDSFMQYLLTGVAPKVEDPLKKFKIAFVAAGGGRKRVYAMAQELFADFTQPDGTVDLAGLRGAVMTAFSTAKTLPVAELGITFDATDAEQFFATLNP